MPRSTILGLLGAAAVAGLIGLGVGLAVGGGGSPSDDAAKEKSAEQPPAQLKFPVKPASSQEGRNVEVPILGGIPNSPPRAPAATATPLPPGAPTPVPAAAPVPPAAKTVPLYIYVDTVSAGVGESKYNVDANLSCVKSSLFTRGMHIVWRMEVVDTSTGKILQGTDVQSATLKLPNGEQVNMRYGRHGSTADAPWFWTAAWSVPPDFPLGVLDYTITISTVDGKSETFGDPLKVSSATVDSRVTIVS